MEASVEVKVTPDRGIWQQVSHLPMIIKTSLLRRNDVAMLRRNNEVIIALFDRWEIDQWEMNLASSRIKPNWFVDILARAVQYHIDSKRYWLPIMRLFGLCSLFCS